MHNAKPQPRDWEKSTIYLVLESSMDTEQAYTATGPQQQKIGVYHCSIELAVLREAAIAVVDEVQMKICDRSGFRAF
jgi:hypothetical protein